MTEIKETKTLEERVLKSKILDPLYILKFGGAYLLGKTALLYFAEKGEVTQVAFNAAVAGALALATYSELRSYVLRAYENAQNEGNESQ